MQVEHDGKGAVVRLPGRFFRPESRIFLSSLKKEIEAGAARIAVDFKDTTLIDSTAIGALVSMAGEAKAAGIPLYIRNLSGDIHALFTDTGLDRIFNIETEGRLQNAEVDIFEKTADDRLDIRTETVGDVCVFHLAGVMNHLQGSRFFRQQFLLAMAQHRKILLDLQELTFFDSLSMNVVIAMNKLMKETGGSVRICNANYAVNDLFMTTNLNQIIPVFNTSAEALAGLEVGRDFFMASAVLLKSFGCRTNQEEMAALGALLAHNGHAVVDSLARADVVVVNTCLVTAIAETKTRRYISALSRARPGVKICVTGCLAQHFPHDIIRRLPVTWVVGNAFKHEIPAILHDKEGGVFHNELDPLKPVPVSLVNTPAGPGASGRTRFFLKIQEGCNFRCAYCVVPLVRGPIGERAV